MADSTLKKAAGYLFGTGQEEEQIKELEKEDVEAQAKAKQADVERQYEERRERPGGAVDDGKDQ